MLRGHLAKEEALVQGVEAKLDKVETVSVPKKRLVAWHVRRAVAYELVM